MSKFTFAFTKEKKQNFVPNGDKTRYVEITGCPIESANGTYYQMDPITINDYTYDICFTNGIYMLRTYNYNIGSVDGLYELSNSSLNSLIKKFYFDLGTLGWYNSETSEYIPEMRIVRFFGDWDRDVYGGQ
jgi:hypothetical protein